MRESVAMPHATADQLDAALSLVRAAPQARGVLELIVARPAEGQRSLPSAAELDPEVGLRGDCWATRGSRSTPDGSAHPDRQLTLMNTAAIRAMAGDDHQQWALAGDQLYVDLDLSPTTTPPGTRLQIGSAVVEITSEPHTGCAKFTEHFGLDALRWVNSEEGMALRLRGLNARVVTAGTIAVGDAVVVVA
jgi:hypothetical protein